VKPNLRERSQNVSLMLSTGEKYSLRISRAPGPTVALYN
jgi:ABC-type branched-subunit amino acid transport system ATPase component